MRNAKVWDSDASRAASPWETGLCTAPVTESLYLERFTHLGSVLTPKQCTSV